MFIYLAIVKKKKQESILLIVQHLVNLKQASLETFISERKTHVPCFLLLH